MKNKEKTVLVLGATGYVGGRLVPRLIEEGYSVRAAGRSIEKLKSRFWAKSEQVKLCAVDVHDPDTLREACHNVDSVYYLIHSMNARSSDFENADRIAANNMLRVAEQCNVNRIVYLGGLGVQDENLSKHLRSRHEVSEILKSGKVPVTVFRAAMIIGSGSASFEILRYLVDRLPVMITPRWVKTPSQPIAIRNVIEYLAGCLGKKETLGETFDIGGKEIISYHDLMRIYAEEAGLRKRMVIPVPVLTPHLSSLWIHLVTPVPSFIARPLAEGLKNPVICEDKRILDIIPQELLGCREAIKRALEKMNQDDIESHWADAGKVPKYAVRMEGDPLWAGGTILNDNREIKVNAGAGKMWNVITRIGGKTGWYHGTWLWILRGFIDRLVGGVGLRRGRRHPVQIAAGDAIDFWRVIKADEDEVLLLAAEMKVPGKATLEFRIKRLSKDSCMLIQKACFQPLGLFGILYWYLLFPLHGYIFGGMIKKIAKQAEA